MEEEIFLDDTKVVEDVSALWWVKTDVGSWFGPVDDWVRTHRRLIVDRPKQKRVVVQAGGNLGMYPNLLAAHYDMVYTFEPDSVNFSCLCMNTKLHNVVKINAALGDKNGLVSMSLKDGRNRGESRLAEDPLNAYIPTFTIDQLALPVCDLIWLDIEESEYNAVLGAVKTIERCRPVVALESYKGRVDELMVSLGYRLVTVSSSDSVYLHVSVI